MLAYVLSQVFSKYISKPTSLHSPISKKILSTWSSLCKNYHNFEYPTLILYNRIHDKVLWVSTYVIQHCRTSNTLFSTPLLIMLIHYLRACSNMHLFEKLCLSMKQLVLCRLNADIYHATK